MLPFLNGEYICAENELHRQEYCTHKKKRKKQMKFKCYIWKRAMRSFDIPYKPPYSRHG